MRTQRLSTTQMLILLLAGLSFLLLGFHAKASITAAGPASDAVLIFGLGESVKLEPPKASKIHISDGGVVRARKAGSLIVLTGKKIGRAKLRFLDSQSSTSDKTLYVTDRKTAATAQRFSEFLQSARGLYLDASALPNLVVRGELLRLEDWRILTEIARANQIPWQLQAEVLHQEPLKKAIAQELRHLSWAGDYLHVEKNGPQLVTNRELGKISAQDRLQLSVLGIRTEHSQSINDLEPMIRTQVVIAEVRRSTAQKLGIKWPNSFQLGGQPTVIDVGSITAQLEDLESRGEGRILAMPNLLCRSGGDAKFFAGGEIPIQTSNYRSTNVEWKKYGITLHVQPRADRLKRLKFQLVTEISAIDHSVPSKDDIPGVTSNRIETQFNLAGAQTVALSGLIRREEGKSLSRLGLLGSIPILGNLFESHDFQNRVTELVIFLTPEITFPGNPEAE